MIEKKPFDYYYGRGYWLDPKIEPLRSPVTKQCGSTNKPIMKIEFVSTKPVRSLGELNSGRFFCRGCGIVPAADDCPVCRNLSASGGADPLDRRRFYITASALMLGLIVIAWAIVLAFGS